MAVVILIGLVAIHSVTGDDLSYDAATAGAAVLAWAGLRRHSRRIRTAWMWVVLGVTSSAVGDVIYTYLHWSTGAVPDVSFADIFWMASYVALSIGVFRVFSGRGRKWIDVDALFDVIAVAVVATVVVGSAIVGLVKDQEVPLFVRSVWASYPILDVALVALVVPSILSRRLRTRAGFMLAGGLVLWLLADFTATISSSATSLMPWMDGGWMIGAGLLGLAVWYRGHGLTTEPDRALEDVGPLRLLVGLAPLLIPGTIEIVALANGRDFNPIPLFAATVLLTGLAFGRALRLSNVSARNKERLQSRERFFAKLATISSDAVVVVDRSGRILHDHHLSTLLGRPETASEGLDLMDYVDPLDREIVRAIFDQTMAEAGVVHDVELRLVNVDGISGWFAARSINLSDDADVGGMVVNLRDTTDQKRVEVELERQAFHDTLTGLANRALFHDRVDHALQRASRSVDEVAVILLDLDGFNAVNESLGHEAGDAVLCEVAARIGHAVRAADTVARLSGDEFAVLVEYPSASGDGAGAAAEAIVRALARPVSVNGQETVVSASFGVAVSTVRSTASSLLRDADVAIYRAKASGKGNCVTYQPEMREASAERRRLESELVHALTGDQFRLVYQPVIHLMTGRVTGFEALLRWDHPTLGLITPDRFIPIIEQNGTIVPIGRWVLRQACLTAARWQETHHFDPPLTMAVNLSTRQIAERDLVSDVDDALAQSGFDPSCLVLEITETALVQDAASAADRLIDLRRLGARVAVDDFGSGYASLGYLRQFPIDILKIDKSFIDTITERDGLPAIVRGVLDLGKTLGLEIVAEGIEHAVQRDELREGLCDLGQGYLFARPLSQEDAESLLVEVAATETIDRGRMRHPSPETPSTEPVR